MGKFRKKPVVITAERYTGKKPYPPGICLCDGQRSTGQFSLGKPHIHTLEGLLYPTKGDWIITGVQGERYPCKPDIFEATYEPAEEPDRAS